ncbi:hypothetical protein C799_01287 [Bacteroides thetaiotaomicron dnLKV9]|uniref:Uncharacterized protein n=1 Tax=Bacteroides thetaiotaomicron dnLKV9 TaxID=1235785 RepID=R9HEI4_BACT4|nr:hypothetical protein C799_01287 [Bacteroides thetaiotaomicron dnLKV9]
MGFYLYIVLKNVKPLVAMNNGKRLKNSSSFLISRGYFILVGNALYNDNAKSVSDKNSIRVILTF